MIETPMIETSCLCGRIRVEIDARPDFIHACNCTLCSRIGANWGYFHPSQVRVTGPSKGFCRVDKPEPGAEMRFCETCGVTTHFVLTASAVATHGDTMMGVNLTLADQAALAGVERRFPDGRGWAGSGAFDYVRAAEIIGA